jgi:hypothetical protein
MAATGTSVITCPPAASRVLMSAHSFLPLDLSRGHWGVENKLHWVRDVSMNEDRCRVRAGARALATLRNLVLWLIRSRGLSLPEARENFREDRTEALAVVTGQNL